MKAAVDFFCEQKPIHMKQIIDGRLYDTEQSEQLGFYERDWDFPCGHSIYECGMLYRRHDNGSYFLRTNASGNPKIIPINDQQARKWAEKELPADDYMKIFPLTES